MRSLFAAVLACSVTLVLSACATTSATSPAVPLTAQQKLTNLAMTVNKQCTIALPFLASMAQVQTDPNAQKIATEMDNDAIKLCGVTSAFVSAPITGATAPAFSLADVHTFVNSNVPQLLSLVRASPKLTAPQKTAAELGITGAQTVLSIAVANAQ